MKRLQQAPRQEEADTSRKPSHCPNGLYRRYWHLPLPLITPGLISARNRTQTPGFKANAIFLQRFERRKRRRGKLLVVASSLVRHNDARISEADFPHHRIEDRGI